MRNFNIRNYLLIFTFMISGINVGLYYAISKIPEDVFLQMVSPLESIVCQVFNWSNICVLFWMGGTIYNKLTRPELYV